jgi:hypothetical protein
VQEVVGAVRLLYRDSACCNELRNLDVPELSELLPELAVVPLALNDVELKTMLLSVVQSSSSEALQAAEQILARRRLDGTEDEKVMFNLFVPMPMGPSAYGANPSLEGTAWWVARIEEHTLADATSWKSASQACKDMLSSIHCQFRSGHGVHASFPKIRATRLLFETITTTGLRHYHGNRIAAKPLVEHVGSLSTLIDCQVEEDTSWGSNLMVKVFSSAQEDLQEKILKILLPCCRGSAWRCKMFDVRFASLLSSKLQKECIQGLGHQWLSGEVCASLRLEAQGVARSTLAQHLGKLDSDQIAFVLTAATRHSDDE